MYTLYFCYLNVSYSSVLLDSGGDYRGTTELYVRFRILVGNEVSVMFLWDFCRIRR